MSDQLRPSPRSTQQTRRRAGRARPREQLGRERGAAATRRAGGSRRVPSHRWAIVLAAALLALAPAAGASRSAPAAAPRPASFAPAQNYPAGKGCFAVAIGDLNGDGKPDLVVANEDANDISVLLGLGDGRFRKGRSYHTGSRPVSVAIGDLNGDGKPDVAVADLALFTPRTPGDVAVLLGTGNGTFGKATVYSADANPVSVAIDDLNGDGKPDLAVANSTSDDVSVLLGTGRGRLGSAHDYNVGKAADVGSYPVAVAIADMNGDGKPDLAGANQAGEAWILPGVGGGRFGPEHSSHGGAEPTTATIGDLTGNGKPDLVVLDSFDKVHVLPGNGSGGFAAPVLYHVGHDPRGLAIGDLNGDGRPDLAVTNGGSDDLSLLLGASGGRLAPARTLAFAKSLTLGDVPGGVAIGDLNGDHVPDLVAAVKGKSGGHVSVFLNTTGRPATPHTKTPGLTPVSFGAPRSFPLGGSVAAADLDGNGKTDLVAATLTGRVSVLLARGSGFAAPRRYRATGGTPVARALQIAPAVAIGDVNRDGKPDLVVAARTVSALLGNGKGAFRTATGYPHATAVGDKGDTWTAVAIGDLNGDGRPDLAVSTQGDGADDGDLLTVLGNGKGAFRAGPDLGGPGGYLAPSDVTIADLNGDHHADLVVGTVDGIAILLGHGGKLRPVSRYSLSSTSFTAPALAVGDVNRDGKPDIVAVDSGTLTVLLGKGNGHFLSHHYRVAGTTVAIGDLNGDGRPDLALGVPGGVSVLLGNGNGTFGHARKLAVAAGAPTSVAIGDFNGDGRPDLAVGTTRKTTGTVTVLLNTSSTRS